MHLKPMKTEREAAEADPLIAIAGGGGVNLFNSMGDAWTADYLKITGELDVDLRSNIAAEARAKIVYERLIDFCDDPGTKDALQFLMTREITHMKAFTAGARKSGQAAPSPSATFLPHPAWSTNTSTIPPELGIRASQMRADPGTRADSGRSWKLRSYSKGSRTCKVRRAARSDRQCNRGNWM